MAVPRDPSENKEPRLLRRPREQRDGGDVEQLPLPPPLLLLGVQHVLHQLDLILAVALGRRQQHLEEEGEDAERGNAAPNGIVKRASELRVAASD